MTTDLTDINPKFSEATLALTAVYSTTPYLEDK